MKALLIALALAAGIANTPAARDYAQEGDSMVAVFHSDTSPIAIAAIDLTTGMHMEQNGDRSAILWLLFSPAAQQPAGPGEPVVVGATGRMAFNCKEHTVKTMTNFLLNIEGNIIRAAPIEPGYAPVEGPIMTTAEQVVCTDPGLVVTENHT